MQTETILLDIAEDTWRSILIGADGLTIITEITHPITVKVGIGSTSSGFRINPGDTLKVSDTIYIKPIMNTQSKTRVVVNR